MNALDESLDGLDNGQENAWREGHDDGTCDCAMPSLAKSEDVLAEAVSIVHQMGVAREDRIIKASYLTLVSQMTSNLISLIVKGTSSSGKSFTTGNVLKLVPSDEYVTFTAASSLALVYTEASFRHKTIVFYEATGLREQSEKQGSMVAGMIRTLLSEGYIIYEVTEKNAAGKMTTRRIVKDGPTNLLVTTTANDLHPENETRALSLDADESAEQTRAVFLATVEKRHAIKPTAEPDLTEWHQLFSWLKYHGEHRVYIPYALDLAMAANSRAPRLRRDFNTLLAAIEASAILHQATRSRDEHGRIIATVDDYSVAHSLVAESFAVGAETKVSPGVRAVIAAVRELGGANVTPAMLVQHMNCAKSTVSRRISKALEAGYLLDEGRANTGALYKWLTDPADDTEALPAVSAISEDQPPW